jgi:leader peptidase (prepilin peptidase)/N-methyltransferase
MSVSVAASCALTGAAAGALLPRVAYRLSVPAGTPVRSSCENCDGPFPAGRAGWVRPGAPCRCTGAPGPSPWWTASAAAVCTGLLGWTTPSGPALLPFLLAAVVGVLLAAVDLRCLRLPDPLVAALAAGTVLPLAVAAVAAGEPGRVGRAGVVAVLCFGGYLLVALLPGGGLGFGDVKLAAVLGFLLGWIGWPAVLLGLAVPHLLNGPVAVFLLVTRRAGRRTALPLGPALLAGALIAVTATANGHTLL